MKTKIQIESRLEELQVRLNVIKEKIDQELGKPYNKRDARVLDFLYKEKEVYKFAIGELSHILSVPSANQIYSF